MFYEPDKNDHGLPYNPFKSICVPRPVAWVSTLSLDGVPNLAPFSQFINLSYDPPYILISARGHTDTARNITATGEFVVNMATYAMREAINVTSESRIAVSISARTESNWLRTPLRISSARFLSTIGDRRRSIAASLTGSESTPTTR